MLGHLLHYLYERKKFLLIFVAVYCILYHFTYKHFWQDGVKISVSRLSSQLLSTPTIIVNRLNRVLDVPKAEVSIAIGSGITSRKLHGITENNVGEKFQFFNTFLSSFCRTASPQFVYRFYLAYDGSDVVFSDQRLRDAFQRQFYTITTSGPCQDRAINTNLTLVKCDHAGKPAWAQNDAMLEAYLDDVDYFYRINDDTMMLTGGWAEKFISTLESYDPPRVGVVGPNHFGGNIGILTYDFVYRTHVDIFGFYYPHLFTDWWGDTWMTRVYKPNRSTKVNEIRLKHTLGLGQRYSTHWHVHSHLGDQLKNDVALLNRYIEAVKSNKASGVKPDGRKVISMSLYGKDPRYTWGVLRNAQLVPVYLPDWTLRVYVAADPLPPELAVPPRIINKLQLLGAEVAKVQTGNSMAPRNWRLLAADDQNVDYFLVRDADSRLSDREAAAIRDWLSNGSQSVIHCIRDHPKHVDQAIVDGLWGGRPRPLYRLLRQTITQMADSASSNTSSSSAKKRTSDVMTLLNQLLWPAISNFSYCHDSVSPCDRWTSSTSRRPVPLPRQGRQYIGQKFDAHQQLVSNDGDRVKADIMCEWYNVYSRSVDLHLNKSYHSNLASSHSEATSGTGPHPTSQTLRPSTKRSPQQ